MLEVKQLSVRYRGMLAIADISFDLQPGSVAGLIGPNGAGKSTLLQAMLGLLPIHNGSATYQGTSLKHQRQRIAYVPQRSQIDWDYPITVWQVVMLGRTVPTGWCRRPSALSRQMVADALKQVEMLCHRDRRIGELSGGQQQRVFLARALAQQAEVFLLDEPFAGIDKATEAILHEVFASLKRQGKILLVSSHEWGQALMQYDRLLLLNQRLIANDTPSAVMTLANLQRAYGQSIHSPLLYPPELLAC